MNTHDTETGPLVGPFDDDALDLSIEDAYNDALIDVLIAQRADGVLYGKVMA